jgi:tetraacyldisaccharide 4'-kinase
MARMLAIPPAWLFGLVARGRAIAYDRGWLRSRFPGTVPVIAIGNLTTGGTGKTPLVACCVESLMARGLRVGLLVRGYRAERGRLGDEAAWLLARSPALIVEQDRDRLAGAARALARGAEVLVLDDAFQHRRIRRDLDLLTVSALDPFGGGWPLPRGLLREPPCAARRADAVVLTHADLVPAVQLAELARRLEHLTGRAPLSAQHVPCAIRDGAARYEPSWLAGQRVIAFSGIGSPDSFTASLTQLGAEVLEHHVFPDHHPFSRAELATITVRARAAGVRSITTAKDAMRLGSARSHPSDDAPAPLVLDIVLALDPPSALEALLTLAQQRASQRRILAP